MFCPYCGNTVADGAKFCPACGNQLAAQAQAQTQEQQSYNAQNDQYSQQPPQGQPYNQNPYGNAQYGNQYAGAQYGAPQYGAAPMTRPIVRRSVGLAILLSIITCGIYLIYWEICLANDLNAASGRFSDASGGAVILLTLVTCGIYAYYWSYKCGEKVDIIKTNSGVPSHGTSVTYLLLTIFGLGIIFYALAQSELNKVAINPAA